jgi:hypothetical protein
MIPSTSRWIQQIKINNYLKYYKCDNFITVSDYFIRKRVKTAPPLVQLARDKIRTVMYEHSNNNGFELYKTISCVKNKIELSYTLVDVLFLKKSNILIV